MKLTMPVHVMSRSMFVSPEQNFIEFCVNTPLILRTNCSKLHNMSENYFISESGNIFSGAFFYFTYLTALISNFLKLYL